MRELQSKQKMKRRLYSPWSLLGLLVLTLLMLKGAVGIFIKEHQSLANMQELEVKASDLSAQGERLKGEIGRLNTSAGVNEEIKEKYNVAEAGEHVAVLVDRTNASGTASTTEAHWYGRLWDAIISAL